MSLLDKLFDFLSRRQTLEGPPPDGVEKEILRAKLAGLSASREGRAVEGRQGVVDQSVEALKSYNERNNFAAAISAVFIQRG